MDAAVLVAALAACGEKSPDEGSGPSGGSAGAGAGASARGGSGGSPGAGGGSGGTAAGTAGTFGGTGGGAASGGASGSGGVGLAGSGNATNTGGSAGSIGGSSGASGMAGAGGTGGTAGDGGGKAGDAGASPGGAAGSGGAGGGAAGGGSADATLVPDPSWACGMPEGVPPPARGTAVFHASLELGEIHEFGETQYGNRRLLDVTGGMFTGDRVQGTILTGGLDLELTLSNGNVELEQINLLRTSDGALVYVRTCGFAPAGDPGVRVVFDFEAPTSSAHAWLNEGKYVGTRVADETAGTIELTVYDVSEVTPAEPTIRLEDPTGAVDQPWDCSTETGARGASVFTETVTLGASISVGQSKRGTRNIIPITGGTVTGRVAGSVLPGGADYQLIGSSTVLDARYTLSSEDGEFILIRNCGPFGALVPLFETRAEGPYAFLNANRFLSSDPGGAQGGVSITFYERQ